MSYPLDYIVKQLQLSGKVVESSRRSQIQALLVNLKLLKMYMKCLAEWRDVGEGLFPGSRIQTSLLGAAKHLACARLDSANVHVGSLEIGISDLQEKVKKLCGPEIRKSFSILSKQLWQSNHLIDANAVRELTENVREILKYILNMKCVILLPLPVKKQAQIIEKKVRFLINFLDFCLRFSPGVQAVQAFLGFLQQVAVNVAYISYVSLIDETNETVTNGEMVIMINELLLKMKPYALEAIKMYATLLKASKEEGIGSMMECQVVSFVDFVLGISMASKIHEIASMQKELIFLVTLLLDPPKQCILNWESMAIQVVFEAGSLCYPIIVKEEEVTEEMIREMKLPLSRLLEKMVFINAEAFFLQLLDTKDSSMVSLMDKFPILHRDLKFYENIFSDPPEIVEEGKLFLKNIRTVSREVSYFMRSIQYNKATKQIIIRKVLALSLLLEKIKLNKAEVILTKMKNLANMRGPTKDHIEALHQSLSFFRKIIVDTMSATDLEANQEYADQFLTDLRAVASESSSAICTFSSSEFTEDMVTKLHFPLAELIQNINLPKAVLLLKTQNNNFGFNFQMKDEFEALHEGLNFLSMYLADQTKEDHKDGKLFLTQCKAVANEVASFVCSLFDFVRNEEMGKDMKLLILELLEKIKCVIKEIYLCHQINVPKTDDLGFVNSLLGNLKELLKCKVDLIASAENYIKMILGELEFFKCFLKDVAEKQNEHEELKGLRKRVINIAYEAEYVIDLFSFRDKLKFYHSLWLSDIIQEIKLINAEVKEIYNKKSCGTGVHGIVQNSICGTIKASTPAIDEVVVGVKDEVEKIIQRLTRGTLLLDIVPIVGMAGLGKTTLAKKVYNDPSVMHYFHVRGWCFVSQVYHTRDVLLRILSDVAGLTDQIRAMSDADMAEKLYKCLKGRRYLIILDDLWDIKAWVKLRQSFPNDGNGSRILFTSRLVGVALQSKPGCIPHQLRLLSEDESWDLLQMKLFQNQDCPSALLEVGKEIAKSCKGLPLSIVLIAGVLGKFEKSFYWWRKFASTSRSRFVLRDAQSNCMDILELSYKHLPGHLTSCFLFLGIFPEDREIPVRKLQWLWAAEGLLPETESKSLEDVAEHCLWDLIDRNLVILSKRRSNGAVKSCRVHDLLRELCIEKAKEENFLQHINGYDEFFSSFKNLNYSVDSGHSYPHETVLYRYRRLSINSKPTHFTSLRHCGPRVHSLLFFPPKEYYPDLPMDLSFIPCGFKSLRVLDLETLNMGASFPVGIELLVHLRYLSVKGDMVSIPSSIDCLWNLQTFVVKGLGGKIVVPDTFWNIKSLRHLHMDDFAAFPLQDSEICSLLDIESLSSPVLYGKDSGRIMRRLPKLRNLKCIFQDSWDHFRKCSRFPALDFLTSLDSLKIICQAKIRHPCEFSFPLNLRKLTLSKFCLPWDEISTIGRLPNLEVLKILFRAFEGQRWSMGDGEFLKLKFLKLEYLDIVEWNASEDPFPCLQELVLERCEQLMGIPSSFGDIPTLQVIKLLRCSNSACDSAKKIQEEQRDMGYEELKVLFHA